MRTKMRMSGNPRSTKVISADHNRKYKKDYFSETTKKEVEKSKVPEKKYLRLRIGMISGHIFEFQVEREDKYFFEEAFKNGDIHEFKEFGQMSSNTPGVVVKLEFAEYHTWY